MSDENVEVVTQPVSNETNSGSEQIRNVENNDAQKIEVDKSKPEKIISVNEKPKERTFTQAEFDEIVKSKKEQAKRQGYELAKNEFLQKQNTPIQQDTSQKQEISPEFEKGYQAAKVEERQQLDYMAAQDFVKKTQIELGSEEANKTVEFFNEFGECQMPTLYLLNSLSNTKDVYDYLKENPGAKQEIKNSIQLDAIAVRNKMSSTLAYSKLLEISARLKQNAQADNVRANNPRPPVSDIKPSTIALGERTTPSALDVIKAKKTKR